MWFLKTKLKRSHAPFRDAFAKKIAAVLIQGQHRIVLFLKKMENCFSLTQRKYLLIIWSLFFGGYCIGLLLHAVIPPDTIVRKSHSVFIHRDTIENKHPLIKKSK
jgi:hypothetical protein